MPTVKNVGDPCAGEPHARVDEAAGGNQASRLRRAAQAPLDGPTATVAGCSPFFGGSQAATIGCGTRTSAETLLRLTETSRCRLKQETLVLAVSHSGDAVTFEDGPPHANNRPADAKRTTVEPCFAS